MSPLLYGDVLTKRKAEQMLDLRYNTGVVNRKVDRGATGIAHGLATTYLGGSYMSDHTLSSSALKVCSKCGETKPLTKFCKDKSKPDGLYPQCLECRQARTRVSYVPRPRVASEVRFWEKVDKRDPDECWEWLASLDGKGYGRFWDGSRLCQAHRYSYELHYGPLGDRHACHSCDNPKCVNPHHIFPGTQLDNMRDMLAKGRRYQPDVTGINNGRAKLNDDLVREARQKHVAGIPVSDLAREYGVGWTTMDLALRGETWPNA